MPPPRLRRQQQQQQQSMDIIRQIFMLLPLWWLRTLLRILIVLIFHRRILLVRHRRRQQRTRQLQPESPTKPRLDLMDTSAMVFIIRQVHLNRRISPMLIQQVILRRVLRSIHTTISTPIHLPDFSIRNMHFCLPPYPVMIIIQHQRTIERTCDFRSAFVCVSSYLRRLLLFLFRWSLRSFVLNFLSGRWTAFTEIWWWCVIDNYHLICKTTLSIVFVSLFPRVHRSTRKWLVASFPPTVPSRQSIGTVRLFVSSGDGTMMLSIHQNWSIDIACQSSSLFSHW